MTARRSGRGSKSPHDVDNFVEVLAACAELVEKKKAYDDALKAQDEASKGRDAAKQRRDQALWRLAHEEHEPVRPLSARLRKSLTEKFSEEELRWCGVSYANVRLILTRPLDEAPVPQP